MKGDGLGPSQVEGLVRVEKRIGGRDQRMDQRRHVSRVHETHLEKGKGEERKGRRKQRKGDGGRKVLFFHLVKKNEVPQARTFKQV